MVAVEVRDQAVDLGGRGPDRPLGHRPQLATWPPPASAAAWSRNPATSTTRMTRPRAHRLVAASYAHGDSSRRPVTPPAPRDLPLDPDRAGR